MEPIPKTMRALVALKYCKPDGYTISEIAVPQIRAPEDVLVRVHYGTISFGDVLQATGWTRFLLSNSFPLVLGKGGCGVVVAVGSGVTSFKVGDEVYGFGMKHPMAKRVVDGSLGWCAEYAVAPADLLLLKPRHLAFEEVASPLAHGVTALQVTRAAMALNPAAFPNNSLEGKTVFVPAGLGASSHMLAQVAKNVYGAGKVITTVSTAKIPLLDKYLPGVFDLAVDYQTQDAVQEIGMGKVDLMYNARPDVSIYLPLMNPESGVIGSLVAGPTPQTMAKSLGEGVIPFWLRWVLNLMQLWYKRMFWGTNIKMVYVSGDVGNAQDAKRVGELLAAYKIKSVCTAVPFDDLDAIVNSCQDALNLKGKIGSLVVKVR